MATERAVQGEVCPRCGAARVHRSRRRGKLERCLRLVGAKIKRCHACQARMTRLWGRTIDLDNARRWLRQAWQLCLALVGCAIVLFLMLWLVNRQSAETAGGG